MRDHRTLLASVSTLTSLMLLTPVQGAPRIAIHTPESASIAQKVIPAQAEEEESEELKRKRRAEARRKAEEARKKAEEEGKAAPEEPGKEQPPQQAAPPAEPPTPETPQPPPAPEAPQPPPAPEVPAPPPAPEAPQPPPTPEAPQPPPAPEAPQPPPAPEAPQPPPAPEAPQPPPAPEAPQPPPAPEAPQPPPAPEVPAPPPAPGAPQPPPAPEVPAPPPAPEAPQPPPAPEAPQQPQAAPQQPQAAPQQPEAAPVLEPVPPGKQQEAAPVLDSVKTPPPPPPPDVAPPEPVVAPAPPDAPPPSDDRQAREALPEVKVESLRAEKGEKLAAPPAPERPKEAVQVIDNRTIININTVIMVETPDRPRIAEDGQVVVERLPRGRLRETVTRRNGVQVVTVRDRHGAIISRSRILPDGREVFLTYAEAEFDDEDGRTWRDPVYDLPPLRLTVPVDEYIYDPGVDADEEDYYAFLERPPIERVERTYSVQDVRRSARVRDKAPRIELGNIAFAFGSAEIAEGEIAKLDELARAIARLIEKNPAESFLIEGHTDAVGSDVANLALSDARAENVARALSTVFNIPPENLVTQGYGERYLKVKTEGAEPLNRRVVFRRITPLVSPNVAAAN